MILGIPPQLYLAAISLIVSIVITVVGFRSKGVKGARSLIGLNLILIVCAVAIVLGRLNPNPDIKRIYGSFIFVVGAVGGVLFLFSFRYCFPQRRINRILLSVIILEPIITIGLALTDQFHPLMRQNIYLLVTPVLRLVPGEYGIWFWIDLVYGCLMYLIAASILTQTLMRTPLVYRRQVSITMAGLAIPFVAIILLLSGITQIYQSEIHLAILSVTNILLAWGVFTNRLGSILPFARDLIHQNSMQGIVLLDKDLRILEANRAAKTFLNLDGQAPASIKLSELISLDCTSLSTLAEGVNETDITQKAQVNGRDLLIFFSPVRAHGLELIGWLMMLHDYTDIRRLENALTESELMHRNVAENADEGILIIQNQLVEYTNARLAGMGGYDRQEVLQRPFLDFVAENERERIISQYLVRIQGGQVPDLYETQLLCQDGKHIDVEINANRIEYGGKPAVVAFVRDITSRKQTERELSRVQGRYRSFVEQSLDGFVLLEENGCVVEWNRAMERITQIERASAIGQNYDDLMFQLAAPEVSQPPLAQPIQPSPVETAEAGIYSKERELLETVICRPDGSRRITQQVISPIQVDGGVQTGITVRDVTDLKQVETNLRDSERRFEAMADAAPVMIWISDNQGNFTYLNKAWREFTGRPQEELMGFGWTNFCHPDDLLSIWEAIKQANREGHGFSLEFRMRRANGQYRWLYGSAVRREALAGQPSGFTASCLDITDHKEREIELRSLTRAIEQSPAIVMITDLKGNIDYVNPRFGEVTGYDFEEVRGKNPRFLKSGETTDMEYAHLWAVITAGGEWHGVFHNKKKNGDLYWEQVTISGIIDPRGQITHFLAIKVDITAQKLAEQVLQQQNARMELIFNNPLIGIGLVDQEGRYTFVNQRFAEMLGYSVDELLLIRLRDATHADDIENNLELSRSLFTGVIDRFKIEKRFLRKDGSSFWGEVEVAPIHGPDGSIHECIGFITDISERRAIQEKLRESEELYRSIIHASPDNITITDLDGSIRFASPIALQMFGYSDLEEWTGRRIIEFLVPEDQPKGRSWLKRVRSNETAGAGEFRGIRRDGSTFTLEVNGDLIKGQSDQADGMIFIARDISARKELEAEQRQRVQQLEALRETMNDVSGELDLPRVLEAIAQRVVSLLGVGECEVALYDEERDILRIVVSYNREHDYTGVEMANGEGIMGRAVQTRKTIIIEDYALWEGRSSKFDAVHRSVICVPLVNNQQLLGAVSVGADPEVRKFDVGDIRMVEMFSQQAAVAINNAKLFGEVNRLAVTDSLTGINNRRAFFDRAHQEFTRSMRYNHRMSVIMLDVDHFKKINDNFGHAAGDEALRVIAQICLGITRESDVAGRYGGEEFVILLPETPLNGALSTAQRLCDQIAARQIPTERGVIRMTASIGVAELSGESQDLELLLEKADQALYRAKQSGRNRVAL